MMLKREFKKKILLKTCLLLDRSLKFKSLLVVY